MMKASFRLIFAALVATAALVACTKEITPNFENDKVNSEGSRVIAVSFAPQTKTYLDKDGFQPKFNDEDSILISNGEALDTCAVDVNGDKATISTDLTGPLTAVYPYKAAKMNESNLNQIDTVLVSTEQSGKFADANICMAKMTSENDESLSFENKTALFKIIPGAGESTQYVEVSAKNFDIANDGSAGSTRTIHVATTTADSVYVSILVPEGLKVGDLTFSDGTNVKTIKDERTSTAIAVGTLYTVTNENWESPEADIPDGALKGVFSVSADKQVYFSQGNLRYVVSGQKWEFYENQYSFCNTTTYDGHHADTVSLFTWGYNATSSTDPDGQTYVEGHTTDGESFDSTEDWGTQIGDGSTWRTLTNAEWAYLLNTRTDAKNKVGYATVSGVHGIILLPDTFTDPKKNNGIDEFFPASVGEVWESNVYTAGDNWNAMELAGAVFLPAAGFRDGSTVDYVGEDDHYWSSSSSMKDYSEKARSLRFTEGRISFGTSTSRARGSSVRLVTNVSAAPTPTPTEPEYVEITMTVGGQEKTYKWAKCNLGAETETGYGDYYFWGTTVEAYTDVDYAKTTGAFTFKSDNPYGDIYKNNWTSASGFAWLNTPFTNGEYSVKNNKKVFTKYVPEDKKSIYGYNDFYDNKTVLELEDDVANKVLGGTWRMPTKEEFDALCNLTKEWKTNYNNSGVDGYLFTDKNNHSIFLPAAGYGTNLYDAGDDGYYWSSSLLTDNPSVAYCLGFNVGNADAANFYRYYGLPVRALSE